MGSYFCLTQTSTNQMLYYPTNALNYIKSLNCLKPIKLIKASRACFGSRRNHHQGATTSDYLKFKSCSTVHIGTEVVSVMAAYAVITLM